MKLLRSFAALPGVTVTVTSKATAAVRTDVTDGEGAYTVTNLSPGAYIVVIELAGFAPKTREVVLGVGQIERVEVDLNVATITEQVMVTADAPVLDLSSAKIGVNVSPEEVQNLPVNGRNFANLMTLATGATSDGNEPGTFGNLPRNFLRGPGFWQADLMFSKDLRFMSTQSIQVRADIFNILNHLNYENPAARTRHRTADADFIAL